MKKWMMVIGLIASLTLFVAGCSNDEEIEAAAIVNGEEISMEEFNLTYDQITTQYEQFGMNVEEQEDQIKQMVIDQLVNTEIIVQKSEETDYEPSEEEIDQEYDMILEQIGGEEELQTALEESDMTKEDLRKDIRTQLKVNQFLENSVEEPQVSEEEIQQSYDDMIAQAEQDNAEAEEGQEQEIPEFEEVKDAIEQQLIQTKKQESQQELIEKLRSESDVEILI
ncbi:SurA N-terminal domain-containing protein [Bacillaceae bacterium S4-13-58]